MLETNAPATPMSANAPDVTDATADSSEHTSVDAVRAELATLRQLVQADVDRWGEDARLLCARQQHELVARIDRLVAGLRGATRRHADPTPANGRESWSSVIHEVCRHAHTRWREGGGGSVATSLWSCT